MQRRGAAVGVGVLGLLGLGLMAAARHPDAAKHPAKDEEAVPGQWARAVSSFVKVRPGSDPGGAKSWALEVARGECEGLQVYAAPPASQVDAKVEPLRGPKKSTALAPRLYREEFIPVKTASNSEGGTGLWPDPLIPVVDAYAGERRNALPHDSTAERPVVLYVEVCVPEAQAPGTYQGALTLTAKGRPKVRIPLSARVLPFALPATSSLPTTFGISIFSLAKAHHLVADTPEGRALLRRYGEAALRHRFTLHGMGIDPPPTKVHDGVAVIDWTGYDQEMAPFLEGTALPNGARFTTAEVRPNPWLKTDAERRAYLRAWREHFDHKGWKQELFFYAKDEPRPEDHPLVLRQAAEAHSVPKLPVLVTSPWDRELTPVADIVTPELNCFYDRGGSIQSCPTIVSPEELRKRIGPKKQLWWYQACPSHGCDSGPFADPDTERAFSGWPSYMVDHPATLNRAMGILDWLAGVDGELYYATVYAYDFRDPWTEGLWDFGGNGDGTLFYPGTPEKIGGKTDIPVESLRLKHLRDGLEDYEYLHLLQTHGQAAAARASAQKLVRSGFDIERDPAKWAEVRHEWATRLCALWNK